MKTASDGKKRCFGNKPGRIYYADYHDHEWGIPVHDDNRLFEMLILGGAQAGLSWDLILRKRAGYRRAFHHFDPRKVATMSDHALAMLRQDSGIIRNRLKINATRNNARILLDIQQEFGSFDHYVWRFVQSQPKINHWHHHSEWPVTTAESDALSKDLQQRGMRFVGSTIIYAYMQTVGMVNDHLIGCWCRERLS